MMENEASTSFSTQYEVFQETIRRVFLDILRDEEHNAGPTLRPSKAWMLGKVLADH